MIFNYFNWHLLMNSYLDGDICKLNNNDCPKPRTITGDAIKTKSGIPCMRRLLPDCLNCEVYIAKVLKDRLKDINA